MGYCQSSGNADDLALAYAKASPRLSTRLPSTRSAMLMKDCDDRDGFRIVYEIDRVGKLVKQRTTRVFFNNRKHQRAVRDVFECCANLAEESKTAHPLPQVVLTRPRGFSDIGLRLRADEGAAPHYVVRSFSSAVRSFSNSSQFLS